MGLPRLGLPDDPGQLLDPSVGDPLLVALPGLQLRPLAAPAEPPSDDLVGVLRMVFDAEVAADHLGDPVGAPQRVGLWPLATAPFSRSPSNSRICPTESRGVGLTFGLAASFRASSRSVFTQV